METVPLAADKIKTSFWASIGKDLNLDHKTQLSSVQREIRRFVKDRERLIHILRASAPYIYYLHQTTQQKHLPAELALIPFIESEYNPNDHSSAGALGLWQLTRNTARLLGVQVKNSYDGRRSIITSTNAALAHFKGLGQRFNGNWYLAISAYNCGEGRVKQAIRRAGTRNFWNLSLPLETQYYTPRLLAIAAIIKNPEKYGLTLPSVENKPYFAELKIKNADNLPELAKKTKVSLNDLKRLNPDYRYQIKPKTLLVPVANLSTIRIYFQKLNKLIV